MPDVDVTDVDTANYHLVGSTGSTYVVMINPPVRPLYPDQALVLAAWLVILADVNSNPPCNIEDRFAAVLAKVRRGSDDDHS